MKNFQRFLVVLALSFLMIIGGCQNKNTDTKVVIGINQFIQHPLLDDVAKGVKDQLKESGFTTESGTTILEKNANGDQNTATQINKQFVDQKVNVIVPLGTPAAQSAVKLTNSIPIVFGAITDPVKAGIAESMSKPGGNKTGTSDLWPYEKQVALIKELVPSAKRIGMILNPGESNTEASMVPINAALKKFNFEKVEVSVSSTSEVYGAAQSLVGRCDVILIPADNTVVSAFDAVVKVANEKHIPLFAGNIPCVESGAIATYGVNYYKIGRKTGELVVKILKEKSSPGTIPVAIDSDTDLVINLKAAKAQNVTIPDAYIKAAAKIFK